ncbi:MAG: NAD(P)H-hydrate dehydratase [Promethearchaeota archaeon]
MNRSNNPEGITSTEMAILDNNSEWLGIPKSHLMECAGHVMALEIRDRFFPENAASGKKVAIFCGTGNNGGDGFVLARHLSSWGIEVLIILVGQPANIRTNEARLNWDIISQSFSSSIRIEIIRDSTELGKIGMMLEEKGYRDIIIDGLLGTGIEGKIREPIATTIDLINAVKEKDPDKVSIVSIDIPSGVHPDTGNVLDKAIKADLVITFHALKKGLVGKSEYWKEVLVKSIGIPQEAVLYVGKGDFLPSVKLRKADAYKGEFGRILIIGGSKNYSGAPAYSSLTSLQFGIDLVITFTPEVVGDVIRSYSPNLIVRTHQGDWLNLDAFNEINPLVEWANTILIGPGMGVEKETELLLVKLLKKLREENKSLVLDADALKLVKNHLNVLSGQKVIVTPHAGELKIMMGLELPPSTKTRERSTLVKDLAKKYNITFLVKGAYDIISDGIRIKINRTGCPEMSIGGTGDVLAGLCACFLATGNDHFSSACSAAFFNGFLGEYTKKQTNGRFTAMDMIKNIPSAFQDLITMQSALKKDF